MPFSFDQCFIQITVNVKDLESPKSKPTEAPLTHRKLPCR